MIDFDKQRMQNRMNRVEDDKRRTAAPASTSTMQRRTASPAKRRHTSDIMEREGTELDNAEEFMGATEFNEAVEFNDAAEFNDTAVSSSREGKRKERAQSQESDVHICMVLRREDYKVRECIMNDIRNRMCVKKFDIDCFASEEMHQAEVWWGPQSPVGIIDAFKTNWGRPVRNMKLWFNPPFSKMARVVKKILE